MEFILMIIFGVITIVLADYLASGRSVSFKEYWTHDHEADIKYYNNIEGKGKAKSAEDWNRESSLKQQKSSRSKL